MSGPATTPWKKLSAEDRARLKLTDDDHVLVCGSCQRACCWAGIFYCDDYLTATLMEIQVRDVLALKLEHPDYLVKLREEEGIR